MSAIDNESPPKWSYLGTIPFGWPLLLLAFFTSVIRSIIGTLFYLLRHRAWQYPSEGRVTCIDQDGQKVPFEDALGYNRDEKTTWYANNLSLREWEASLRR